MEVYAQWLKRKFRIDRLNGSTQRRWRWEPRDRALFQELLYGVVRRHGTIKKLMERLSTGKIRVEPFVYSAAAVALYQLRFLDRVPDHAAVDTSVQLAKEHAGQKSSGWVNAVLRRAIREGDSLLDFESEEPFTPDRLAFVYSCPRWMVSRWMKRLSTPELREFLTWNNRSPSLTLRVNRRLTEARSVAGELSSIGVKSQQHALDHNFLTVLHPGDPAELKVVRDGRATPQDISQGLVAALLDPQPGEAVLDLCAAPGGKTGHMAEICPESRIVSTDKSPDRLHQLRQTISRCRLDNVEVVHYDEVLSSAQRYDAILVDAPCTGTGVLARRPDLRWRRNPEDVGRMADIQLALLRIAADKLKDGGRIIYSTCSVEPEENGGVVDSLISGGDGWTVEPADRYIAPELVDEAGFLSVLGPEIRGDGVFAARLRKTAR